MLQGGFAGGLGGLPARVTPKTLEVRRRMEVRLNANNWFEFVAKGVTRLGCRILVEHTLPTVTSYENGMQLKILLLIYTNHTYK